MGLTRQNACTGTNACGISDCRRAVTHWRSLLFPLDGTTVRRCCLRAKGEVQRAKRKERTRGDQRGRWLTVGSPYMKLFSCGAVARSWISITNNLAEGSGRSHDREFRQYFNIARRSLFEDASMLMVFESLGLLRTEQISELLTDCDLLSRKITSFSRKLCS